LQAVLVTCSCGFNSSHDTAGLFLRLVTILWRVNSLWDVIQGISALHPFEVAKLSTGFSWGEGVIPYGM